MFFQLLYPYSLIIIYLSILLLYFNLYINLNALKELLCWTLDQIRCAPLHAYHPLVTQITLITRQGVTSGGAICTVKQIGCWIHLQSLVYLCLVALGSQISPSFISLPLLAGLSAIMSPCDFQFFFFIQARLGSMTLRESQANY